MHRATSLLVALFAFAGSTLAAAEPIVLKQGPHLLLDDYLIERSADVERVVLQPQRFLKEPIVTGAVEHQNWQPFLTVLHTSTAPADQRFRMWYNADVVDNPADGEFFGVTASLASTDGIRWTGPYQRLESLKVDGRVRFGACVLDQGPPGENPAQRYKMLYFDAGAAAGPRVAFSADGLNWNMHNEGQPVIRTSNSDDIWTAGYDPLRNRYFLIGKTLGPQTWTNADGRQVTATIRRYTSRVSSDFKTWSEPKLVYSPDEMDAGITQWYGSAGYQVRGDLIVGFLRELRDDQSPSGVPPKAVEANTRGQAGLGASGLGAQGGSGMGYTVLTWTRDGETWQRDRYTDKFFVPDPAAGAWDHAMSWVGSSVPVGDELYLYYAGYRWGHKYHHSLDRQIGLIKIPRDRFVARRAKDAPGLLVTRTLVLDGDSLTLNANAEGGEIRVQVTSAGEPLPGFGFEDCRAVAADSLNAPVTWAQPLAKLRGQEVRLEFSIKNADLFAFDLK